MPNGMDARLLLLQAQRQLQQSGDGHAHSQQQLHQQHGHPSQPQRPGGDAAVASYLLQLKENDQVPVTEAEATYRLQVEQHQAALSQAAASRSALTPMPVAPVSGLVAYPQHHTAVHIPGMYSYAGMNMVPFPHPNAANFGIQSIQAYPSAAMHHAVVHSPPGSLGLAPIPGGVPGLNHAQAHGNAQSHALTHGHAAAHHAHEPPAHALATYQQQQLSQHGMSNVVRGAAGVGVAAPAEMGPVMTDAYIESLISTPASKKGGDDAKNGDESGSTNAIASTAQQAAHDGTTSAKDDMNLPLVVSKDRDLIPDALFVALGQMKPCKLQQSDRVGCYKTRTLGFLGMCCKHCGGQPGFGRYFPNSVRSLAQTTTSQTILKHVGGKCRFCPPRIRKAVLELQRQQQHKEHLTTGRPRYGSRKIFFQRMWARLHGRSEDGETAIVVEADVTPEVAKAEAAAGANISTSTTTELAGTVILPGGTVSGAAVGSQGTPKRSSLPEVSNNNTDDEDAFISNYRSNSNSLDINLRLDHSHDDCANNKRKRDGTDGGKESSSPASVRSDDDPKKLRISPVEV